MPFAIRYEVDGAEAVEHRLLALGQRAVESRPLLEAFMREWEAIMADTFDAEGYGTWEPLSPVTVARKGSSAILRETDALMDSLTSEGTEGAVREIFGDELVFGTSLTSEEGFPYPAALQSGTSRMPARDPLTYPDTVLRRFTKQVHAYLMGAERAEFGVGSFGMSSLTFP
jgi:phage gpG-like protein